MKTIVRKYILKSKKNKTMNFLSPHLLPNNVITNLLNGKSNREIADRFGVTVDTAKVFER